MDHAGDAFFLYDEENRVVDLNQRACESLGYTREELIGKTPLDFDPDITPTFLEDLHREFASGVEHPPFETRHRRKDGTIFPVEVRIQVFFQGSRVFCVALARDIAERKRVEERLRHLAEQHRLALEAGNLGTCASTPVAAVLSHGMRSVRRSSEARTKTSTTMGFSLSSTRRIARTYTSPSKRRWY